MNFNMYEEQLLIPKDRIAVLVGKKGQEKRELENCTHCRLNVDSKSGEVKIISEDSLEIFQAKPIIKAIARGFNPKIAELLLNEEYMLDVIELKDFSHGSKKKEIRLKSRVIGKEGKAREMIESLSNTHICVYGKTVAVIGKIEDCGIVRKAIESLLKGAPHGNVYRQIITEKKKYSEKVSS